ncbi:MAG: glyoxalase-like domain protein [Myxococcaceae bacterium]|nr:glyoxalase-like domain protein [Myxococcaceae bacterium]
MLTKLDHVTIAVLDVNAAAASYQRLLGRAPIWRGTHPEVGTAAALFGLANALIELTGPFADAPDAAETEALRNLLQARGEGLQTLSFGTDDAARCTRELRERGVRATSPQEGQARSSDGALRTYRLVELSPRATRALALSIVERSADLTAAAPDSAQAGVVQALDHVLIASADLEQALVLYRDQLGLRLALDTVVADARMLFFRVGGVTLEIVHDASRSEADALMGLAYRVDELEAAHTRLRAEGVELSDIRAGKKPGTRVFTVRSGTHGVPTLLIHDPSRVRPAS